MKKVYAGIPGWCVIFELQDSLFAMVNLAVEERVQFSNDPKTFTKHGYFADAADIPEADIRQAEMNLDAIDLSNAEHLLDTGRIAIICPRRMLSSLIEKMMEVEA